MIAHNDITTDTASIVEFAEINHVKKRRFLAAFQITGTIIGASNRANTDRHNHGRWLATDPENAKAFERAQLAAGDNAEQEAWRRAMDGDKEAIVWEGKQVKDEDGNPLYRYKKSDVLLIFMLKGVLPGKYAERIKSDSTVIHQGVVTHINVESMSGEDMIAEGARMLARMQSVEGEVKVIEGEVDGNA